MHKSNNDTKGEIHRMFKSVYHGACFSFSPFSGFLECVFTLLWGKHLRGLFNGCPQVSTASLTISSCRASTSGVEVPGTVSALTSAVDSCSTFPTASAQEYSCSPSFPYTDLPGYTVVHFRSSFHSVACTHGLETAEQGACGTFLGPGDLKPCLAV